VAQNWFSFKTGSLVVARRRALVFSLTLAHTRAAHRTRTRVRIADAALASLNAHLSAALVSHQITLFNNLAAVAECMILRVGLVVASFFAF